MLQLNQYPEAAILPDQREHLKARISHTDEKINQLVYQLYGLTMEEIAIVENFRGKSYYLLAVKAIKQENPWKI
jgi:hypothetical protein